MEHSATVRIAAVILAVVWLAFGCSSSGDTGSGATPGASGTAQIGGTSNSGGSVTGGISSTGGMTSSSGATSTGAAPSGGTTIGTRGTPAGTEWDGPHAFPVEWAARAVTDFFLGLPRVP